MSHFTELVKNSIKNKNLFSQIAPYALMKSRLCSNYTAGLMSMDTEYRKLNKKYSKYIGTAENKAYNNKPYDGIWFCWLQGKDNMPDIVKACYNSVKENSNAEIRFVDADNFCDYVSLPDYIIDKWQKGVIPNANFSDILRTELLLEHGGLWLDATTLLTGALPGYITDGDFFVYRNGWMDMETIAMSSWLIYSKPGNILLRQTQKLMFIYWQNNNHLVHYFIMHMFFRMVTERYSDEWSAVPYYSQNDSHILQFELQNPYSKKRYNQITQLTPVHKLTHKLGADAFNKGTVLDYILNQYL